MRARINDAVKAAMKAGDKPRVATLRLITAAIQNHDLQQPAGSEPAGNAEIIAVLQKMLKQRRESIAIYRENNRDELAAQEEAEVTIIEEFLPKQMDEAQTREAVSAAITETGAGGMKDMGKVMGVLKSKHAATMDFGSASAIAKEMLK